jgi:hypothetical protein
MASRSSAVSCDPAETASAGAQLTGRKSPTQAPNARISLMLIQKQQGAGILGSAYLIMAVYVIATIGTCTAEIWLSVDRH